jgi:lysophospholipase L1-like esterase
MLECLVLGDSIAVGTARARPECVSYAKGGWNSWQWNRDYLAKDLSARTVVISLGSNDHQGVKTKQELLKLRKRVEADRVYWIMPAIKPHIQEIVEEVAHQHGDWIIQIPYLSTDGVHPSTRGYNKIGEITK